MTYSVSFFAILHIFVTCIIPLSHTYEDVENDQEWITINNESVRFLETNHFNPDQRHEGIDVDDHWHRKRIGETTEGSVSEFDDPKVDSDGVSYNKKSSSFLNLFTKKKSIKTNRSPFLFQSNSDRPILKVGLILPKRIFLRRNYIYYISKALNDVGELRVKDIQNQWLIDHVNTNENVLKRIQKSYKFKWHPSRFKLDDKDDSINFGGLTLIPPPTDITDVICEHLSNGSAAIIYFKNNEQFGQSTAASQYLLQMTSFLGIPVMAWNADNSGLEYTLHNSQPVGHAQFAPSMSDQVKAMLSIIKRYDWNRIGVVTTKIAGHNQFLRIVRDEVRDDNRKRRLVNMRSLRLQSIHKLTRGETKSDWDVMNIVDSTSARIFLLYCTQDEASEIMTIAEEVGLTNSKYLWLVTQSVIGEIKVKNSNRNALPTGTLGIHFDVKIEEIEKFIRTAFKVFFSTILTFIEIENSIKNNIDVHGELKNLINTMLDRGMINKTNSYDGESGKPWLNFNMNCEEDSQNDLNAHRWKFGSLLYKILIDIKLPPSVFLSSEDLAEYEDDKSSRHLEKLFNKEGSVIRSQLKIVNLRRPFNNIKQHGFVDKGNITDITPDSEWDEVGTWSQIEGLKINDIVWPGNSAVPPDGVPDEFHVKITFLEEAPFIMISDPDPISNTCTTNRGIPCSVPETYESDPFKIYTNRSTTEWKTVRKCCTGLCIDLLRVLQKEIKFTYELTRSPDPRWGSMQNGQWNGLMYELAQKKTDMVLTALKISTERQRAAKFTIPYLDSGIALVVARRTGIISPTAFLEPFDVTSWLMIIFVGVQISSIAIFIFEWISVKHALTHDDKSEHETKFGGGRLITHSQSKKDSRIVFSMLRSYWLVWAELLQASVNTDCPRSFTARFMSCIWSVFAVVFLAMYTANLAVFMIPRKEFFDLTGLDDPKISNPFSEKPPLRISTMSHSYMEMILEKYHHSIHDYIHSNNNLYNDTQEAIQAVKDGDLDVLIHDGTVINYHCSQDADCRLLQVGTWSAMTGYAIAFPLHSKIADHFQSTLLQLKESGEVERLYRYWLGSATGSTSAGSLSRCMSSAHSDKLMMASEPLSVSQFLSAFYILIIASVTSVFVLFGEKVYNNTFLVDNRGGAYISEWLSSSSASKKSSSLSPYMWSIMRIVIGDAYIPDSKTPDQDLAHENQKDRDFERVRIQRECQLPDDSSQSSLTRSDFIRVERPSVTRLRQRMELISELKCTYEQIHNLERYLLMDDEMECRHRVRPESSCQHYDICEYDNQRQT